MIKTIGNRLALALLELKEKLTEEGKPGTAQAAVSEAFMGLGCLGRSEPEEPVFILVGRDQAAADTVRVWANTVEKMGGSAEKVAGARAIAEEMDIWRIKHGGGKLPD